MGTSVYFKYAKSFDFNGARVLNLGCGFDKLDNATNLDKYDNCNPQVIHDLDTGTLPFADESFDLVIANHVLEHIPNWWEIFEECSRVLAVNGRMEVWVPGSGTDSIFGYRDHVNEINACSFFGTYNTFRARGNAWARAHSTTPANRLKCVDIRYALQSEWWIRYAPKRLQKWMSQHLRNTLQEIGFYFRKVSEVEMKASMQA